MNRCVVLIKDIKRSLIRKRGDSEFLFCFENEVLGHILLEIYCWRQTHLLLTSLLTFCSLDYTCLHPPFRVDDALGTCSLWIIITGDCRSIMNNYESLRISLKRCFYPPKPGGGLNWVSVIYNVYKEIKIS